jgi:hypothetical protein
MSCNYYDNKNPCGTIIRDVTVTKEITNISDRIKLGDNQIDVIEENKEIAYFDTLFLTINENEFLIVKRLYLDNRQKFSFKINKTEMEITLDDRDPIKYDKTVIIQFMATGTIYTPALGDFTSTAAASAAKAEIERTSSKTVKYVLPFRVGMDSVITNDYVMDSRLCPVLVDK